MTDISTSYCMVPMFGEESKDMQCIDLDLEGLWGNAIICLSIWVTHCKAYRYLNHNILHSSMWLSIISFTNDMQFGLID